MLEHMKDFGLDRVETRIDYLELSLLIKGEALKIMSSEADLDKLEDLGSDIIFQIHELRKAREKREDLIRDVELVKANTCQLLA